MFPSSGDLWIYDFTMVNGGSGEGQYLKVSKARGWLSTSKARSQALVRQPARAKRPECHLLQARLATAGVRFNQFHNSMGQG